MNELDEIIEEYFDRWSFPNISMEQRFRDVFRDAFEMGQLQWTLIEDGLPKESGTYLVTLENTNNGKREISLRKFDKAKVYQWEFSDTVPNWKVIAWMQLPKPYEVNKNE